jgi:hypothetical protein
MAGARAIDRHCLDRLDEVREELFVQSNLVSLNVLYINLPTCGPCERRMGASNRNQELWVRMTDRLDLGRMVDGVMMRVNLRGRSEMTDPVTHSNSPGICCGRCPHQIALGLWANVFSGRPELELSSLSRVIVTYDQVLMRYELCRTSPGK